MDRDLESVESQLAMQPRVNSLENVSLWMYHVPAKAADIESRAFKV